METLKIIEEAKVKHGSKNALFLDKYLNYYSMPVNEYCVLYESFSGCGVIDNPYGVFKEFERRPDFSKYIHIWVVNDYNDVWFNIIEYSKYNNVKFVLYGSNDYLYYLSISKYLINNCTFPSYFIKKPEQVYINTWHGITNKHLGYEVPNSNINMGNTIRNFLSCDYIVSANSSMTDLYQRAYKLDGLWEGKYIEAGQPRNDYMFSTERDYVIKKLESFGVKIDRNKKIILYAPTWKGTLSNPKQIDFSAIAKVLNVAGYQVLVKAHHVNYQKNHQYIPASMDTNELISICDVLVTDYSSIYYDWILMDKPVIFYAPDYATYKKEQGLYYNFPFAHASDLSMLKVMINHIDELFYVNRDALKKENHFHNEYVCNAARVVLNTILDGDTSHIKQYNNNKIKLLFYAGDFKPNGVTTSFTSLLKNINYDKYDVSVLALKKDTKEYIDYVNSIDPRARVLCRSGTYATTLLEECANEIVLAYGIGTDYLYNLLPRDLYTREFLRCFGKSKFDKLINFTGYSPFYGLFFMCNDGEKIIWQHNDMVRDQNREENGVKPLYKSLASIFTMYPYYDKLISASKEIMYSNIKEFPYVGRKKFHYAHNTLDYDKVKKLSNMDNGIEIDVTKMNFINNSRLSYAKNHVNLIRAFHRFHKLYPSAELYLIGDGNLKDDLIKESKNEKYIHITGYSDNPFYTMNKCDCFVFPSLYEGQGISLLEARVLDLPIVVSPLPRMKGIFLDNGQYELDGFSEDDIFNGLCEYVTHKDAHKYKFDAVKYNKTSYKEFEKAIDI